MQTFVLLQQRIGPEADRTWSDMSLHPDDRTYAQVRDRLVGLAHTGEFRLIDTGGVVYHFCVRPKSGYEAVDL